MPFRRMSSSCRRDASFLVWIRVSQPGCLAATRVMAGTRDVEAQATGDVGSQGCVRPAHTNCPKDTLKSYGYALRTNSGQRTGRSVASLLPSPARLVPLPSHLTTCFSPILQLQETHARLRSAVPKPHLIVSVRLAPISSWLSSEHVPARRSK